MTSLGHQGMFNFDQVKTDILGTSWGRQGYGPYMSHTDVKIWCPGDVLGTSKSWSREVSIWRWILMSWRRLMDVRPLVQLRSLTDVIFWHRGNVHGRCSPTFDPDVAGMVWGRQNNGQLNVIYWHYILKSRGRPVDVRTLIRYMSFNDIHRTSCGRQNYGQLYVICWCQFLTSTGHPVDVRTLVRYMSYPDVSFWHPGVILGHW